VKSAKPKAAAAKVAAFVAVVLTLLIGTALPAVASTGAPLADAQPWHYWIAFVILFSAGVTVVIMLPIQYYKRVYRLKHPKR
jgi:fumarate reductase subunit D